jgi:hypothetical protein
MTAIPVITCEKYHAAFMVTEKLLFDLYFYGSAASRHEIISAQMNTTINTFV